MTAPLDKAKPRNPVRALRLPTTPPGARSLAALRLTAAAAEGRFELQTCFECGTVQYPPRSACVKCLSHRLEWRAVDDGAGELISETLLHHSNELYYRERVPLRQGLVRLDSGPVVLARLHGDCPAAPSRVRVRAHLDKSGQAALVALPPQDTANMMDDPMLREMTSDPRFRKVLITDGKSAVGQATARALVEAGADIVWAGVAEPWKQAAGLEALAKLPQVEIVSLDVTDERSVRDLAGVIGGKVDILVNTAEFHRTKTIADRGTETARAEMEVNYLGLLRLAQAFGPAMRARAAEGSVPATAWVNLLSIYSLSALPSHGTFSASKAAAFALSQNLRAEMRHAGIRVVHAFPGPIDDEWNQLVPPPKLAPSALARAIVTALRDGVEDIYPGDVAQDIITRFRESQKVLERELWDQ
jgi:NAD(P)-dependent dehydrogenase (short-subunit alcohol dehydrogenase family)/uncharacterized OB-fold protein